MRNPREKVGVIDEHGHLHYFPADTHEALVEVGKIWREGETWCMDEATGHIAELSPELAVCDFCSQRPVTWDIDVHDFCITGETDLGPTTFTSTNGWVACEPCGALVATGQQAALLHRLLEGRDPDAAPALVAMQMGFWRHFRSIKRYPLPYRTAPPEQG